MSGTDSIVSGGVGNSEVGNDGNGNQAASSGGYIPGPGEIVIDPASLGSGSGENNGGNRDGTTKRRRGRPPGKRASADSAAQAVPLNVSGIEAILLSSHAMLAMLVRVPELELEKDDAEKLASGIHAVGQHYNWQAAQKTIDITNLCMTAAAIYGAKIMLIRERVKNRNLAKRADENPPVFSPRVVPGNSI